MGRLAKLPCNRAVHGLIEEKNLVSFHLQIRLHYSSEFTTHRKRSVTDACSSSLGNTEHVGGRCEDARMCIGVYVYM